MGCHEKKLLSQFGRGGKQAYCTICRKLQYEERKKQKREEKKESEELSVPYEERVELKYKRGRDREAKRKYKAEPGTIDRLYREQGGRCAICNKPFKLEQLFTDHDHVTGRPRGLLDMKCNFLISNAGNSIIPTSQSIEILESAIRYLRRFQSWEEEP